MANRVVAVYAETIWLSQGLALDESRDLVYDRRPIETVACNNQTMRPPHDEYQEARGK